MTKVLKTTDRIRLANWNSESASIGNIWEAYAKHAIWVASMAEKGFPIPEGSDLTLAQWCDRNRQNGGGDVWAIFTGHMICDSKAYYEEAKRIYAAAIVVEDGEVVEYCGRKWKLTSTNRRKGLNYPEFSNPFRFELVVEEAVAA